MPDTVHAAASYAHVVQPLDAANQRLVGHLHPAKWVNPRALDKYDLVVLGGGTAGLVAAAGAAGLGARVALVERALLGGDCLNVGCVPSKALLRSARAVGEVRAAARVGVAADLGAVDFAAIMRRLRERRAGIAENDSAARFARLGVHVFFGEGRFAAADVVEVSGQRLRFRRAVIATGGRPDAPPIDGLAQVPYLDNETLFTLTERPERLLVLGAGPIGCEMAQAFARLGTQVTVIDRGARILSRDDADAAAIVQRSMERDGVHFALDTNVRRAEHDGRTVRLVLDGAMPGRTLAGDRLLVAAGRRPNVEGLALDAAGIDVDRHGVIVDDRLRTSNSRVFASGDVCSKYKFTHAADAMSRVVLQNALFFGRRKASALTVPWCTYTFPELAHVGVTLEEAASGDLASLTVAFEDIDRAILDDDCEGFVRVHHRGGRLVGCTIVGAHAGDLIGLAAFAVARGATLADFSATIFPYPTVAEAFRKAGDAHQKTRLTPLIRRGLEMFLSLMR